jgi:hypothetical protein
VKDEGGRQKDKNITGGIRWKIENPEEFHF